LDSGLDHKNQATHAIGRITTKHYGRIADHHRYPESTNHIPKRGFTIVAK